MAEGRIPLYYTFGNHQHWVDFHWLWSYEVLPDAVDDMVKFCDATGAKACLNFDGIGYEKMASENPEDVVRLKDLLAEGRMEVVGCSYGQPYGLFHPGESNVRQRIYGVRAVKRILGIEPKTYWEEEFDFFPQLPQMLAGVGMENGSLYFQWTWHTPEIPKESSPTIWWEGLDGTRLLTASRNALNLHQWPEDFQILLDDLAAKGPDETLRQGAPHAEEAGAHQPPFILQWLELMPSPDWMCRSELMIPKMQELIKDERFEIKHVTLGDYINHVRDTVPADGIPVRSYSMDEVWHGMSLGKNAYGTQRASFEAERMIQSAEAIASVYGLFGRPYPRWNVYPFFTLEEAWRQLLMAQHHDNEECEWLCGDVAKAAHEQIVRLVEDGEFGLDHLVNRIDAPEGALVLFNPTGWDRTVWPYELGIAAEADENEVAVIDPVEVPAFGFAVVEEFEASVVPTPWQEQGKALKAALGEHQVELDPKRPGLSLKKGSIELGELFQLSGRSGDEDLRFTVRESKVDGLHVESEFNVLPSSESVARGSGLMAATVAPSGEALDVALRLDEVPDPDPGFGGAYCATLKLGDSWSRLFVDQPYSVVEIEGKSKGLKKYPSGDWMTSKQWFEEIENAFTSQTFVDLVDAEGNGYLIIHNGCQQWFREGQELKVVLSMKDPWEQGRYLGNGATRFRVVPHGPISNAERYRLAQQFLRHPLYLVKGSGEGATALDPPSPIQPEFSFGKVEPENVVVTALYRETEHDGKRWENYAGKGMGFPYVMRLVEFNGESAEVNLQVPGPVEKAAKTDLLGREIENLKAENNGDTATLRFEMRPHEIATLYLDIVPGRKQTRDLDAHRDKWATVHRVEDDENRAP